MTLNTRRPVRIGIIGVGQIGKVHLDNYAKVPGAEVVAAFDIDGTELERVAEQYKIPHTHESFKDLLQRDDIEAVDVCLHNNLHAPITIAALEAGKHVYCEKPMAGTYVDAKSMMDAARRCDRKLSIQLGLLFKSETKVAKHLIRNGHLGRLYHARSCGYRRRGRPYVDGYGTESFVKMETAGGGALFDMGVYHISQMLYLLDSPQVFRVSGELYQETEIDPVRAAKSGYNVEELGLGLVRFEGGVTLDIIESWAIHLNAFEGSSIVGSKGGIRLDPFSFHTTLSDVVIDSTFSLEEDEFRWHALHETEDAYDSPQHHWVSALQGRVPLLPTAEIALQTMQISEGIRLSHELGREVTADEIEALSKSTALKV
ncbi:MAG: Gfo/Idh/MocA family oxidoreductase [Candidatus Hydrogenedentes bacterium]|nr:Gfo/Idh/MocA family oxidoreductase [Candidatus Hydrogenedentota bacterium]